MTDAQWSYVCRLDEIVPNTGVCAKIGAAQVAVFRLTAPDGSEDAVYALSNIDPKSGASVLSRGILGDVGGVPVVASPVYKQHYALADGRCLEDEALSVASYPARIAEGLVIVRRTPEAARASAAPA
jgi:NAD(P)H-dependent nitrite reductase small subunit